MICAPFVWISDYAKNARAHKKSNHQYESKGEVSLVADV